MSQVSSASLRDLYLPLDDFTCLNTVDEHLLNLFMPQAEFCHGANDTLLLDGDEVSPYPTGGYRTSGRHELFDKSWQREHASA